MYLAPGNNMRRFGVTYGALGRATLLWLMLVTVVGCEDASHSRAPTGHVDAFVVAVSAADGRQLWSTRVPSLDVVVEAPTIAGGRLELVGGLNVDPNHCAASPTIFHLDAKSGALLGQSSAPSLGGAGVGPVKSLTVEGTAVTYRLSRVNGTATVSAFRAAAAHPLWSSPLPDPHHDVFVASTLAVGLAARGVVYLAYVVSNVPYGCGSD